MRLIRRYLVTETLEPDNNRADLMREARERALLALNGHA